MPGFPHFKFPDTLLKAPGPESLSPPERRRKLLLWTAAVHAAVLLIPLLLLSIGDWLSSKPKSNAITVTISGPRRPAASSRRSGKRAPRLRPPKAQPKPKTKPVPEPKIQPKPAAKTKPVPAKTANRTAKTPPQKTPPPRKEDPWEDLRPASQSPQQPDPSAPESREDASAGDTSYDEGLVGTLYELWKPPSDALLAGRRPVVLTRITVNPAGRVLKTEILRRSGFGPMDESVQKLLNSLSDLPKPPKGRLVFEIEFTPYE